MVAVGEARGEVMQLPDQERVLGFLHCFASDPPNVVLLEGGGPEEREQCALYWSALLNCASASSGPCLECSTCTRIFSGTFRDQYFFSGREGPIKIEDVRGIRNVMGQKPDSDGFRVFIVSQAQELTSSAANALLKSMEEPLPNNVFVLLAPERNKLLPTLVSRSWVLTLKWSDAGFAGLEEVQAWVDRLLDFWDTGKGLFEHTAKKSDVDADLVRHIIGVCQKSLLHLMIGRLEDPVSKYWGSRLDSTYFGNLDNLFQKSLQALDYQVSPPLVLDWLAIQVYQWCNPDRN